jgi:hypothetical protein
VANEKSTKTNGKKGVSPEMLCRQGCQMYGAAGATCGKPCPKPRDHKGYHTCADHRHTEGIESSRRKRVWFIRYAKLLLNSEIAYLTFQSIGSHP